MAKQKFYVVIKGHEPGIYENWNDCKVQVDGFKGAEYKSFKSFEEAQLVFDSGTIQNNSNINCKTSNSNISYLENPIIEKNSICVDGACSGNPGIGEYQCVDTKTQEVIFNSNEYYKTTNNLMEFFALVEAIKYVVSNNLDCFIYSDSKTAISWVKNQKVKTSLVECNENYDTFASIQRCIDNLKEHPFDLDRILKWDTKEWGEIPADFGRK